MTEIAAAVIAGVVAGIIMLFLSHIAPLVARRSFLRDVDQPTLFGRLITRRAAHGIGIVMHLALAGIFGGMYALGIQLGVVTGYGILQVLVWSLVLTVCIGLCILPLEGHGVFGIREDAWFPVDLTLTNILWACIFWWVMRVWTGL